MTLPEMAVALRAAGWMVVAPDSVGVGAVLADVLRNRGWTCSPPPDPDAALPDVAVGQVWRCADPTWQPRKILQTDAEGRWVVFSTGSGDRTWSSAAFAEWARRTGARPVAG